MIAVSSIVWKLNSDPLDETALPHLNSVHAVSACSAYHPNSVSNNANSRGIDPESIYTTQQNGQFKLTRFYYQITNLFCCTHRPISSPELFGCSVNNLSGPIGANSSTGNLLEPTSLTNANSTNNNIYGQHHHHRRFLPRLPNSSGRSNHPYGAMFYPDFEYRPPPPSYQASMQEYRLRMLLYERATGLNSNNTDINNSNNNNVNNNTPVTGNNNNSGNSNTNSLNTNNTSSIANANANNNCQTTSSSNTFSGLLSNLGNFVSNSFSGNNQQQNLRTLSPPPVYRSTYRGTTLAGKNFIFIFKNFNFNLKKGLSALLKLKRTQA